MLETVYSPGAYGIIVSDALEILLFGIYTIFFVFALMILTIFKRPLPVDWPLAAATITLYALCMGHCSIVTTDRHTTFTSGWPVPTGTEMSGLLRVGDVLLRMCSFTSQIIMIHRCWAVWEYQRSVVAVPVIMSLSGFVCALIGPTHISTALFVSPWISPRMLPFDIAFYVISLLVYSLVTFLIVVRLRSVSAPVRVVISMETLMWSLVGACIQAGVLLLIVQVAVVVLIVLDNPGLIIAESVATQVYGIAPTMMIIQLGLSLLPRGRGGSSTAPQFSTLFSTIDSSEESDDVEMNVTPVTPVDPTKPTQPPAPHVTAS